MKYNCNIQFLRIKTPLWKTLHKIPLVMRMSIIMLFCFVGFAVSNESYAQKTLIDINMENTTVENVLNEIEKMTEFTFFYNTRQVDVKRNVSLNVKRGDVFRILDRVFKGTNITYKVLDKKIILSGLISETNEILQQIEKKVTGHVKSQDGEAIIGATVTVRGNKNIGTVTDIDGNFQLLVPMDAQNLEISYIGFEIQTTRITDAHLQITLSENLQSLEEVVVVGYATQKKANLTGAVSSISAEVLENRPNYNIGKSLQGTMPNVNITLADGKPGRGTEINIRGLSVMTGNDSGDFKSASPFILIDGIPGDLNMVNPNDVESISVLKDAASASIYGARGAYGVVLITTKNGKKNQKIAVNASFNYSFSRPIMKYDMEMDPYTYMYTKNLAWTGYNGTSPYDQRRLDYALQLRDNPDLPRTVEGPGGTWEYYHQNNWFDKIYSNSVPQMQANINLSGGTEKVRYYLSLGYVDQEGIFAVNPDKYTRYKANAKITITPNEYVEIYNYTDGTRAEYEYPTWFGNDVNVWRYMQVVPTTTLAPEFNPDGTRTRETFFLAYLKEGGRGLKEDVLLRNTTGFTISPKVAGLFLRGDFTYSHWGADTNDRFKRVQTSMIKDQNDYYLGRNSVKQTRYYENYYVLNLYADYERAIGKHNFKGLVGFNNEFTSTNNWWAQRDNVTGDLSSLNLANGTMYMDQAKEEFAVRGYFFRVNYNFGERYLLEANGRYDLTSRFPRKQRGGFFPSASVAWRVTQEKFMETTSKWLSDLKIRASYGSLGNQQVSNYSFFEKMSTYQIPQIIGSERPLSVYAPEALPNKPTWEKSSTIDVGLDLGFLGQKLVLGFDYYVTDIKDMLTKGKTQPAVFGANEPRENAADLRTKGWDFTISYSNKHQLLNSPFSYRVTFNMGDNYTEVTKFDNPARLISQFYVGQRLGEIWGLETLGLFQVGDDLDAVDQTLFEVPSYTRNYGDLKWKDQDGDNIITRGSGTVDDPGDFIIIGNSLPRYNYGFSLSFDWYGFNVDALFQGVGKRDYYPGSEASYFWSIYNRPANSLGQHIIGNYWTEDNPDAYFPRLRGYLAMEQSRAMGVKQTRFLQNAAYLRFKNLTIGYTIPKQFTQKFGINRLNVYVSGENLAVFTKLHKTFDPEAISKDPDTVSYWGDGISYPMSRTFSFGLNINF